MYMWYLYYCFYTVIYVIYILLFLGFRIALFLHAIYSTSCWNSSEVLVHIDLSIGIASHSFCRFLRFSYSTWCEFSNFCTSQRCSVELRSGNFVGWVEYIAQQTFCLLDHSLYTLVVHENPTRSVVSETHTILSDTKNHATFKDKVPFLPHYNAQCGLHRSFWPVVVKQFS